MGDVEKDNEKLDKAVEVNNLKEIGTYY